MSRVTTSNLTADTSKPITLVSAVRDALRLALTHALGGPNKRVLVILPPNQAYTSFCSALQSPLDDPTLTEAASSPEILSRIALKQCNGSIEIISLAVTVNTINPTVAPSLIILISPEELVGFPIITDTTTATTTAASVLPACLITLNTLLALLCGAPFSPLIHFEFTNQNLLLSQECIGPIRAMLQRVEWPLTYK